MVSPVHGGYVWAGFGPKTSKFGPFRPFSSIFLFFDVDFPLFDPKASTFRRGTPAEPPGSAPAYPGYLHEGCDPARRSLHLFTPGLFTLCVVRQAAQTPTPQQSVFYPDGFVDTAAPSPLLRRQRWPTHGIRAAAQVASLNLSARHVWQKRPALRQKGIII